MTFEVFEVFGPSAGCDEETRAISAGVKTEQSAVIRPGLKIRESVCRSCADCVEFELENAPVLLT